MKKIIVLFWLLPFLNFAQNKTEAAQKYQTELVSFYNNAETTPLDKDEKQVFKGITFFDIDEKFIVEAELEILKNEKPFLMPSTGKKQQEYKKYGILHFTIDEKPLQLVVYQNIALSKRKGFEKNLFLPFYDLTSGEITYGGGRYLDVEIPDSNKMIIDFNKAYNPYCAYSIRYSCPITPEENFLDIEIKAGVTYSNNEI
nr:DUF1684 domain-containing protein [uncultured Flavobacterium sp.]